jgi:hypothetical protein
MMRLAASFQEKLGVPEAESVELIQKMSQSGTSTTASRTWR